MFKKLRNRIILTTMAATTAVVVLAGTLIVLFASTMRPEPRPRLEPEYDVLSQAPYDTQELENYIKTDRKEGNERLVVTLICVGGLIEVAVFVVVYFASQKMVEPVKESYDKQKMFIANASHELKTPLAIIQANMEALDVDKNSEKWKDNIECEINYANKLVLDLLQLAKMDAGSLGKNTPEMVDVGLEVEKRVGMFGPKFAGGITCKQTAEPIHKLLPKQDFLQVLDILLDNATKYGEKKIVVTLDKSSVSVVNDGATIAQKDLGKVFDRFYQTDKSKGGSGLGLAIAKALCEQNGWNIRCESTRGKTRFTVSW